MSSGMSPFHLSIMLLQNLAARLWDVIRTTHRHYGPVQLKAKTSQPYDGNEGRVVIVKLEDRWGIVRV